MVQYCFAERPRELFTESVARGCLAAILDFPHVREHDETQAALSRVLDELRPDVCCTLGQEYPYYHLVVHAWVYAYTGVATRGSERLNAQGAFHLKQISEGEALARIRHGLAVEREMQEEIERMYAYYCRETEERNRISWYQKSYSE